MNNTERSKMDGVLQESEEILRSIYDHSPVGMEVYGPDGSIKNANIILKEINNIYKKSIKCETLEEFCGSCLGIIEDITGSKYSFVGEIGANGLLQVIAISDMGWEACKMLDKADGGGPPGNFKIRGLFGSVLKNGMSIISNDPSGHPDSIGLPEGHPQLKSFLGVPLVREGRTVGLIGAANRDGGYRIEDREMLEALAPTILETILHKRSEEEIRVKKSELSALVENSTDIIARFDREYRYVFANTQAEKGVGYSREQMIGKTKTELGIPEKGSKMFHEHFEKVFTSKRKDEFEFHYSGPLGEKYFNSVVIPEFGDKGDVQTILCIMRDVTEMVQNQKLAKAQSEQLLLYEKEKNDALNKAMDMKDEILSIVSHEFRTPLTVINSAVQMMDMHKRNGDYEKAFKYTENIKRNVNRQIRLVNNLLDITRANAGQIKTINENLDIVFLSKSIIESIREFSEAKGIYLHFHSDMERHIVSMDEEKYERILFNLLSNAFKFTSQGKSVFVGIKRDKNKKIYIKVNDEGIGIPEDKRTVIFEQFGQVDRSLTRRAEGTGIGLSLVNMLVKSMNGAISVISEEGKGSSFIVSLPDVYEADRPYAAASNKDKLVQIRNIEFADIY